MKPPVTEARLDDIAIVSEIEKIRSELGELKQKVELEFEPEHFEDEVDFVLSKKVASYKKQLKIIFLPFLSILSVLVVLLYGVVSWGLTNEDFRKVVVEKYILDFKKEFKPEFDAHFAASFRDMFSEQIDKEFPSFFNKEFNARFQDEFANAFKAYFEKTLAEKLKKISAISFSDQFSLKKGLASHSMTFFAEKFDRGRILCDAVFPNDQTKAVVKVTINNREEPIREMRVRPHQSFTDVLQYVFIIDEFKNFYSDAGVDQDPPIHQLNFDLEIANPGEDTIGDKSVAITCLILVAGEVKFGEVE